jgi:hypothetical protein
MSVRYDPDEEEFPISDYRLRQATRLIERGRDAYESEQRARLSTPLASEFTEVRKAAKPEPNPERLTERDRVVCFVTVIGAYGLVYVAAMAVVAAARWLEVIQ